MSIASAPTSHSYTRRAESDRQPSSLMGGPAELARRLTIAIADEADADQWAVAVDGISGTGPADFEEPFPRPWLQTLNGGRPAAYRLTLVLRHGERDLGIVRLGTFRPCGFQLEQIKRGRGAADQAAQVLAEILQTETQMVPRTG
jgi:hypothetical protein